MKFSAMMSSGAVWWRSGLLCLAVAVMAVVVARPTRADDEPSAAQTSAVDGESAAVEGESAAAEGESAAVEGEAQHSTDEAGGGHAEGAHEAHDDNPLLSADPGSAIWNLVIFLIVLLVLGVFVWPQILAGLQAREDKIHSDLESAEQANRQAQSALAEYQTRLDEAQGKVQEMLAEARRDAEQAGARIVAEAKADADRQRDRALADIEAAKTVAIADLANQTSDLAMSLARQVVGRELNANDHADLIRQSLDKLPSRN